HELLLGEDGPAGARAAEPLEEPRLLRGAQHALRGRDVLRARGLDELTPAAAPLAAGLHRAVLAVVEHEEVRQAAPAEPSVEMQGGPTGQGGATQGHVLVVRLIGAGAPLEEGSRVAAILSVVA